MTLSSVTQTLRRSDHLDRRRVSAGNRMTCPLPLLIHADGTASCPVSGCIGRDTLEEAVRRHHIVVNCLAVLGPGCPECNRSRTDQPGAQPRSDRPVSDPVSTCPGIATVHVDLSLECSEPSCEPRPWSRSVWLAKHVQIRSCRDFDDHCPLCSAGSDPA